MRANFCWLYVVLVSIFPLKVLYICIHNMHEEPKLSSMTKLCLLELILKGDPGQSYMLRQKRMSHYSN